MKRKNKEAVMDNDEFRVLSAFLQAGLKRRPVDWP